MPPPARSCRHLQIAVAQSCRYYHPRATVRALGIPISAFSKLRSSTGSYHSQGASRARFNGSEARAWQSSEEPTVADIHTIGTRMEGASRYSIHATPDRPMRPPCLRMPAPRAKGHHDNVSTGYCIDGCGPHASAGAVAVSYTHLTLPTKRIV